MLYEQIINYSIFSGLDKEEVKTLANLITIKNKIEALMKHQTVGINDFVRRQLKGTGKTYSSLSFQEIAEYAENQLNSNHFEEVYRDGVIVVKVDKSLASKFHCPFTKIVSKI